MNCSHHDIFLISLEIFCPMIPDDVIGTIGDRASIFDTILSTSSWPYSPADISTTVEKKTIFLIG